MTDEILTEEERNQGIEVDDNGIRGRRVKVVMINPFDFVGLLTKGAKFRRYTEIIAGVPIDAEILAMSADTNRHGIMFVIHSDTYPIVPLIEMPPIEALEIQTELKNATKALKTRKKKK